MRKFYKALFYEKYRKWLLRCIKNIQWRKEKIIQLVSIINNSLSKN